MSSGIFLTPGQKPGVSTPPHTGQLSHPLGWALGPCCLSCTLGLLLPPHLYRQPRNPAAQSLFWASIQRSSTAWLHLASLGIHGLYHYPKINLQHKTRASQVSAFPPGPLHLAWLGGTGQRAHSGASALRQWAWLLTAHCARLPPWGKPACFLISSGINKGTREPLLSTAMAEAFREGLGEQMSLRPQIILGPKLTRPCA